MSFVTSQRAGFQNQVLAHGEAIKKTNEKKGESIDFSHFWADHSQAGDTRGRDQTGPLIKGHHQNFKRADKRVAEEAVVVRWSGGVGAKVKRHRCGLHGQQRRENSKATSQSRVDQLAVVVVIPSEDSRAQGQRGAA